MKKRIAIIMVLIILSSVQCSRINAIDSVMQMKESIDELNRRFWRIPSVPYEAFNNTTWGEYKIVATDKPFGDIKLVNGRNEYRYLGNTIYGEAINNPEFPEDYPLHDLVNKLNWQINLDSNTNIRSYTRAFPAESQLYKAAILQALEKKYGALFDPNYSATEAEWFYEAAILLQPMTDKSRGLIRFEHQLKSGNVRYITIVIPTKEEVQAQIDLTVGFTVPVTVTSSVIQTTGTLNIAINSFNPITSYEIVSLSSAVVKDTKATPIATPIPVSTAITELTTYTARIPINVPISKDVTTGAAIIRATDSTGKTIQATNSFRITRQPMTPTPSAITTPPAISPIMPTGAVTLQAMPRGAEIFDVTKGIPTDEKLYVSLQTDAYSAGYSSQNVTGSRSYTVTITGSYATTAGALTAFSTPVTVIRDYTYQNVTGYYVYAIDHAVVNNYALPKGSLTMTPKNYQITASQKSGGISSEPSSTTINIGTVPESTDLISYAESAIGSISTFNGNFILNGTTYQIGDAVPAAPDTDPDTLYQENLTILKTLANKKQAPTTATVSYKLIYNDNSGQSPTKTVALTGNNVTVHTPVTCTPTIEDRQVDSQAENPDTTKINLLLGDLFTITYPTEGAHLSQRGYGTKDYKKYIASRQVSFPFDVYNVENSSQIKNYTTSNEAQTGSLKPLITKYNPSTDSKAIYIPANTWMDFPVDAQTNDFYIPAWVKESTQSTVRFRTLPTNLADVNDPNFEYHANLDLENYKAVHAENVTLTGQMYDFKVSYVGDPNWQPYFKTGTLGLNTPQLPISPGKNTVKGYESTVIKLGYPIYFDFMTNGDVVDGNDYAVVKPKLFWVDETGAGRQEVDAYVSTGGQLLALGSATDPTNQQMVLSNPARKITESELVNTAAILDAHDSRKEMTSVAYLALLKNSDYRNIEMGGNLRLSQQQRTFVGPYSGLPAGISTGIACEAIQKWYGQYFLPNSTYFVPKGTKLETLNEIKLSQAPFFQKGYIIVQMDIEIYKDVAANIQTEQLSTINAAISKALPLISYTNQWDREGFLNNQGTLIGTMSFNTGDIAMYDVNKRGSQNYY